MNEGRKLYPPAVQRRGAEQARIKARIARRGIETRQKLGRRRWVIERRFAWLNRFRRLTIDTSAGSTSIMPSPHSRARSFASERLFYGF